VNGSLREALDKSLLDDTGKAIVVTGVVIGMKFIHSHGVIHRDLKPANILLEGRCYPKISDLGSGRFFDLGLTMTSMIGTPRYMAPEMFEDDDYSPAVDVYSFSLIVYELLVGEAVFPAMLGLGVLMGKIGSGARPPLPGDMDETVRDIIARSWSVDPNLRDSFDVIFDLLRGIRFKLTPAVDSMRVHEFLSQIGCDCGATPQPDQSMRTDETADSDAVRGRERRASDTPECNAPEPEPGSEFGVEGPQSLPDGAAWLMPCIECPAFKTVMKGLFRKKPVQRPATKKGKTSWGTEYDVPDGIIAYLTRICDGNVHDRHIVDVTCGSFEKETRGAHSHSGAYGNRAEYAAKNAAEMETDLCFLSAYRKKQEDIPHTRNNWIYYDFKDRRIVPTHYAIRTHGGTLVLPFFRLTIGDSPSLHLKSWLVETSADGESWREVDHKEDNGQLNNSWFTGTFAVVDPGKCRFIRLVNIGRNHWGSDSLNISAWEIFGTILE
jgi:hypothetical protein